MSRLINKQPTYERKRITGCVWRLNHCGLSLSKKSFPVGRVGNKTARREVGIFFFSLISFFFKLECTGGKLKKTDFFEKMEKKFQSALLDPPGRYTGNTFLFKGGPSFYFMPKNE